MKEVIIITEFDEHFSKNSCNVVGVAGSFESAESLIEAKYSNDYQISSNGNNQVLIEDAEGNTIFGVQYDSFPVNFLS